MHRRWRYLVPVAVLALAATAAVLAGTASSAGKITLTIWDQQQSAKSIQQAYTKALRAFEKANPNVKVKIQTFPYAVYRDKLLVAMKGGSGPDVMTLDEIWTPEFAAAGLIVPLDDYLKQSKTVKPGIFFAPAWNTNLYKKQTWGVPLNFDVWEQMYYNADLFRAAGLNPDRPPATWPQWIAALRKLNKPPDQYGIALLGCKGEGISVVTDSLMYSNGGRIVDEKTNKVVLDSPANRAAMTMYKTLAQYSSPGPANICESDSVSLFTAGKAAMILDGSWQQDTMRKQASFDWRIAVPPAPAGKKFVGALGGWNLAINKRASDQDMAFKLIEFLSQKDVEVSVNSLIPARRDGGAEFVQQNRKQPAVILKTLQSGAPRPISPVYPQLSDVQQAMSQSILGGTSVTDALAKAQKDMEKIVKQLG